MKRRSRNIYDILAYSLLLILSGFLIIFGFHYRSLKTDYMILEIESEFNKDEILNTKLDQISKRQYELMPVGQLLPDTLYAADYKGDSIRLIDLISERNTLIFRYTELGCSPCIDEQLEILNKFQQESKQSIVILSYYRNIRNLGMLMRSHKLTIPVYNFQLNLLPFQIDSLNIPYFFVLNQNHTCSHFFIPEKNYSELTESYLQSLINPFKQ